MAKIENLDQIRAKNAWNACNGTTFSNADGGEVVKKLSPMIRENGMLGALAFALAKKDDRNVGGYADAFNAICVHLNFIKKVNAGDAQALQTELLECDSLKLRDVTAETMLYLNYLRRFGKNEKKGQSHE